MEILYDYSIDVMKKETSNPCCVLSNDLLLYLKVCARSEVGLSRLPVTEEIAGSNPVGRAKKSDSLLSIMVSESFFLRGA